MYENIIKILRNNFKPWNGIHTLMERGWIKLPIRASQYGKDFSGGEEVLAEEVDKALKRFRIDISEVKYFSMTYDGNLLVQIDEAHQYREKIEEEKIINKIKVYSAISLLDLKE